MADLAGLVLLDRDRQLDARHRVVEREAHLRLEVGAALRPAPAAAAERAGAADPAEAVRALRTQADAATAGASWACDH